MDVLAEAFGIGGRLKLYEEKIIIKRKGFLAFMTEQEFAPLKGEKEFFLRQIYSIEMIEAGRLSNGFIRFTLIDLLEGSIMRESKDENMIFFTKKQQPSFEKIRIAISERASLARRNYDQKINEGIKEELRKRRQKSPEAMSEI